MSKPKTLQELARRVSQEAHKGQLYGTQDYFGFHVCGVVDGVKSCDYHMPEHVAIAYLHDVVEDTEVTIEDLDEMGFPVIVLQAVDKITRRKDQTYDEYMLGLTVNPDAALVKFYDSYFNYKQGRRPKYAKNMRMLEPVLTAAFHNEKLPILNPFQRLVRELPDI